MRADRIEMVPHDPSWRDQFAQQAEVLTGVLAQRLVRDIEHIGSTAVPGLCSRDATERRLSFCYPTRERRTHHLHVVFDGHEGWRGWIAFRDRLRRDEVVRRDYAELKRRLAAEFGDDPNDRDRYRAGKADLIQRITAAELGRD